MAGLICISFAAWPADPEENDDSDFLDGLYAEKEADPEAADEEEPTPVITLREAPPPAIAKPSPQRRQIDEMIVTATKREASSRDLPMSIDAFSGDDLEKKGANSMEEFLRFSPGVSVNQGLDQDSVFVAIRGITANSQGGFFNRPTGLFYNDVTLVNPSIRGPEPNMDPFDMSAVEVLKGPQGTLFGGSALAGAVRYLPQAPIFDEPGLSGRFTGGISSLAGSEDMAHNLGLAANLAASPDLALRFAGSARRYAGTIDDLHSGESDINSGGSDQFRLIGAWRPTDALDLELSYLRREAFQDDGSRSDSETERSIESRRWPDTSRSVIEIPRLELTWAFEPFDLVLSGSRLRKTGLLDFDQTRTLSLHETTAVAHQLVQPDVTQPAAEVRMVSSRPSAGLDGWDWLLADWDYAIGLFWQRSDQILDLPIFVQPAGNSPLPPLPLPELPLAESPTSGGNAEFFALGLFLDAIAKESALYFDTTRHLGTFDLNLGGRLFRQTTSGGSAYTAEGGTAVPSGRATLEETGFNPKLSLTWHASDNIGLYAAATRGFRYGGINPVLEPDTPLTFKSDKLWNYEIGLRSQWLGRSLQFDLTAFYIDWTDVQIDQVSIGILSYADNVGAVRSQGVEAATRMLLPWGLSLDANAAYVDSRTTEEFESVDGPVPPGTRMPATPYYTASASLSHAKDWERWMLTSALSVTHADRSTNNLVATYELPAHTLANFGVALTRSDWESEPRLSLNVNNLFDEMHVVSAQTNIGVGVTTLRTWFNAPRTASLNLSFRF